MGKILQLQPYLSGEHVKVTASYCVGNMLQLKPFLCGSYYSYSFYLLGIMLQFKPIFVCGAGYSYSLFVWGACYCYRLHLYGYHVTVTDYGEFHPGRELTAIEMENFWLSVKPISVWIYLQDFCAFVYVSIFLGKRSSSILFTSFTC